jgi:hypothetical protein
VTTLFVVPALFSLVIRGDLNEEDDGLDNLTARGAGTTA